MSIPRALLRHTVTTEPLAAQGAYAASYGAPVEVRCLFSGKRGSATASDGSTVSSSGKAYTDLEHLDAFPVGSRVTDPYGRTVYVLEVTPRDTGGLVPLDHLEVTVG